MSELLRKVNDPLRLKLKIEPKDDAFFVRARVTAPGGALINEVELPNVGNGVYEDDLSETMPNLPEVKANYFVFYDAAFTEVACEHGAFEVFKRDDFDPKTLVPAVTRVKGQVKTAQNVMAKVAGSGSIKARVAKAEIGGKVQTTNEINATVRTKNKIKGVVYE